MSFSIDSIESEPHAYIQFDADEVKACVPLNFILSHPTNWRDKKAWNDNYLYKVFWGPKEEDTPSEMLKNTVSIPMYERGTSLEKPGYYRVSVLATDESLQALEEQIEKKRISVGVLKYKHTSFDELKTKTERKVGNKDAKVSKKPVKPKSRGLDKSGHKRNINFDNTLESKYDFLKGVKEEIKEGKSQEQLSSSSGRNLRSSTGDNSSSKGKKYEFSDDSDLELDGCNDSKKIKLDPNYTPKKTAELEEKLKLTEKNLDTSYKRNQKLESYRKTLQDELERKQVELADLKQLMDSKVNDLQKELSNKNVEIAELKEQVAFLQQQSQGDLILPEDLNVNEEEFASLRSLHSENSTWEAMPGKSLEGSDNDLSPLQLCTTVLGERSLEVDNKKVIVKTDEGGNDKAGKKPGIEDIGTEKVEDIAGDHQLCPGVIIKANIWEAITSLPKGPGKDKIFIKDLLTAAFGPEVLASCTIFGTKKGGRKKKGQEDDEKEEKVVKPALNKAILKAVREKLIARVEADEGSSIEDPDDHPRSKILAYHQALRDGQRRLIILGYGCGTKDNTVHKRLLMGPKD